MRFHVIGDKQTVLGFRLVGVEGTVATEREAALEALHQVVEARETGIVLVTEAVAGKIRDEVEARLYGMGFPLVLEIPDAGGPADDRPEIDEIVRKAVGISI
ncbi:MAG: V-type ATP synthase subunit F [bacterium]|jgi:V/A-type H+-transporting ATPase subunit F